MTSIRTFNDKVKPLLLDGWTQSIEQENTQWTKFEKMSDRKRKMYQRSCNLYTKLKVVCPYIVDNKWKMQQHVKTEKHFSKDEAEIVESLGKVQGKVFLSHSVTNF